MKAPLTDLARQKAEGFSVFEFLIVVAMISIVTSFALLQTTRARNLMIRENATRHLTAYLEKARLHSVSRAPTTTGQMAQVSILNATFYSVTTDSEPRHRDGDFHALDSVVLREPALLEVAEK